MNAARDRNPDVRYVQAALALIMTLVLAFGHWRLASTRPISHLDRCLFQTIDVIPNASRAGASPVAIIDLGANRIAGDGTVDRGAIDPLALAALIRDIADQQPAAIGLDLDLSPSADPRQMKSNRVLLDSVSNIQSSNSRRRARTGYVQMFVGVERSIGLAPPRWLGDPSRSRLAAMTGKGPGDSGQMLRWIAGRPYGRQDYLESMAAILSAAYLNGAKPVPTPSGLTSGLVEMAAWTPPNEHQLEIGGTERRIASGPLRGFRFVQSPVNFSYLDAVRRSIVRAKWIGRRMHVDANLRNRIVLIGDASPGAPAVPIDFDRSAPHVIATACAFYTFAQRPIYLLKRSVRAWLDIILSLSIVVLLYSPGAASRAAASRIACMVIVMTFGVFVVRSVGIRWLDFVGITAAIALFPAFDGAANQIARRIRPGAPRKK